LELLGSQRSIGFTGSKTHEAPGDFNKRFATVCILIRAEGEQPEKIHIILHGTGTRIRPKESKNWHPNVVVHFSETAWQNEETLVEMIKAWNIPHGSLVLADQLRIHFMESIKKLFHDRGCFLIPGPKGCTDYWQQVDCQIGTQFNNQLHV